MCIDRPVTPPLSSFFESIDRQNRLALTERLWQLDPELWHHARLVAQLTDTIACELPPPTIDRMRLVDAAWLHDIGKLTIDRSILDKPGPLTPNEWIEMRTHSVRGSDFFADSAPLVDMALLIRHHHERFDGTGYPDGLAGDAIPLGARIICVADAFDAMTTERTYRPSMTIDAATSELQRCAGTQFDPLITEICISILHR